MPDWLAWTAAITAAYLVGAVPFGLLLGLAKGIDIREHGSGNIGATNLLRTCGVPIGILGFALDLAKGIVPVLAAGAAFRLLGASNNAGPAANAAWLAVGAASIAGHIFPLYLRFKGGKGVATALGMLLGFYPFTTIPALAAFATWFALLRLTRYVSIASIGAAVVLPLFTLTQQLAGYPHQHTLANAWPFPAGTALIAAAVIIRHADNINRLRLGTESKIGSNHPPNEPHPSTRRTRNT